jgi:hypothetical protein
MELSPSWEADSHVASQEIPRILKNLKIECRVHKRLTLVPLLSHTIEWINMCVYVCMYYVCMYVCMYVCIALHFLIL